MIIDSGHFLFYHKNIKVFLNGKDVTKNSFYVDTKKGIVMSYKLNSDGMFIISDDGTELVKETQKGNVIISANKELIF
jgi:hypothetical protein